jgi:hypothetical protein
MDFIFFWKNQANAALSRAKSLGPFLVHRVFSWRPIG